METRKAIIDYVSLTSGSRTAARTAPNDSSTRPRPSDTITKSSTQATSQNPTNLNSSTTRRTGQKSSFTSRSSSSAGISEHLTPSQTQPVTGTSQTEYSHSTSLTTSRAPQKAQTTSRSSPSTQPLSFTFQSPSLDTVQKHSAISRTPKESSKPAADPESSTSRSASTSQSTLRFPHPYKSSTRSQALLDSSQHCQGPSRGKRGKGRRQ